MIRIFILLALLCGSAAARDNGQWGNQSTLVRQWFQQLMQPDDPIQPCCGQADAYWADSFEVEDDHYVAVITDERLDAPIGRPHIDVGTRIPVPNQKMKFDAGNPTGHGVIFVGSSGQVYCYVAPGGV
jgi:hypothetical protein